VKSRLEKLAEVIKKSLRDYPSDYPNARVEIKKDTNSINVYLHTCYYTFLQELMELSEVYGFLFYIDSPRLGQTRIRVHNIEWTPDVTFRSSEREITTFDGRLLFKSVHWFEIRPTKENIKVLKEMTRRYQNKIVLEGEKDG